MLGLPSSTAIYVMVCFLDRLSCWQGSQKDEWSKSCCDCSLCHLSHFIILISCFTVTEHLIHRRWYSTSCFTSTLCQRITRGGNFCGVHPIIKHDLILLDTKPIQGVIVLQVHLLSPRSVEDSRIVVEVGVGISSWKTPAVEEIAVSLCGWRNWGHSVVYRFCSLRDLLLRQARARAGN